MPDVMLYSSYEFCLTLNVSLYFHYILLGSCCMYVLWTDGFWGSRVGQIVLRSQNVSPIWPAPIQIFVSPGRCWFFQSKGFPLELFATPSNYLIPSLLWCGDIACIHLYYLFARTNFSKCFAYKFWEFSDFSTNALLLADSQLTQMTSDRNTSLRSICYGQKTALVTSWPVSAQWEEYCFVFKSNLSFWPLSL